MAILLAIILNERLLERYFWQAIDVDWQMLPSAELMGLHEFITDFLDDNNNLGADIAEQYLLN